MSCLHHSSVRLVPLLASLLSLASLFLTPSAQAGYYQLTAQTGGLLTYKDATFPTFYSPSPYGYGAMGNANEWADCSGQITTTFEWQSSGTGDDPPKKVIIAERCSASWVGYGVSSPAFGVADNGLGSPEVPNGPVPIYDGSGNLQYWEGGGDAGGTRYRIEAGQQMVTVTCSPQARTNGGSGGYAEVSLFYSANVYPVTVEWTGATLDNGTLKVLTGQQATATLTIGSNTVSTPPSPGVKNGTDGKPMADWTITGNVFKNYDPALPQNQLVALAAADTQKTVSVSLYTKRDKDPINATCTATLEFPAGARLEDGLPVVTVESKDLISVKPTAIWKINDSASLPPGTPIGFFNDIDGSISGHAQNFGANEVWYPIKITVPSHFSGGLGCIAQLATTSRQLMRNPTNGKPSIYSLKIPITNPDGSTSWIIPGTGLDKGFPYPASGTWSASNDELSGDSPKQPYTATDVDGGGNDWNLSTANDSFETWLMYKPASVGSQGAVWIPLQKITWSWNGTATKGTNGNWTVAGSATSPSSGTNIDAHPEWNLVITGQQFRP